MAKIISKILYLLLKVVNFFLKNITKVNLLAQTKDLIEKDLYKEKKILNKKINFFIPNEIIQWRVDTLFEKEPETIEWINNFKTVNPTFWDIGANIGLYSLYSAVVHQEINVVSFEPSTSNLRVLSRNIAINGFQNKIKISQMALTEEANKFQMLDESEFIEGWSMSTFGKGTDYKGEKIKSKNSYQIFGTNINYLLKNNILPVPNYIKIDVDGIEHIILRGAGDFLKDLKIKSILVEVNEKYTEQYENILKIMNESNFKFKNKYSNNNYDFPNNFNYIFERP